MNIYSLRHMKGQVKRHRYIWYKSPSSVLINGFYSATLSIHSRSSYLLLVSRCPFCEL
uniref:Uncharacterized protein LOC105633467 isoform X3 n=1 Tax=Rhizophora mucronata TaxID=61149 RepID=A0A2P2KNN3_RHIMU